MTSEEAYAFSMLLALGLTTVVVAYMAWQLAPNRRHGVRAGLDALKAGLAMLALTTVTIWLLPGSPLRVRAHSVAETRDVMIILGAVLAVVLAAAGTASMSLCLRRGLVSREQVPGTIAVIVAAWVLVTFGFAWLALG